MIFNRQRSAASTEQSAPRSGIKITRLGGNTAKPGKVIMMTRVRLIYSYLMICVSVHQACKCEKRSDDVLPAEYADG